ncbi:MAG: hypothetical protein LBB53_05610, partial [Prevotellaceae bacterium]|nr:hypothetical protein [Prevotellaceae bacterium]
MKNLFQFFAVILLLIFGRMDAQNSICYYLIRGNNANINNDPITADYAKAYLSWETNSSTGAVEISIHPYGSNPCEVQFKDAFFQNPETNFKVNGTAIGANGAAGSMFYWVLNSDKTKAVFTPLQAFDDCVMSLSE